MNFFRLVKSDFIKMKHTSFYPIHIIMPLLGAILVLSYYSSSALPMDGKVEMYLELLGIVFPTLIAIISASVVKMESEAGNFKEMLGTEFGRTKCLLSKIVMLIISGFVSLSIAIGVFALGMKYIFSQDTFGISFYIAEILIIMSCQVFIYIFHVFLSLQFGTGASIIIGIFETILAGILMSGLGEKIWVWIPSGWSIRLSAYYLYNILYKNIAYVASQTEMYMGITNVVGFTIIICACIIIWFKYYEGKIEN